MTHTAAPRAQPDAAATFETGELVRVVSHGTFTGMTGRVVAHDAHVPSCVSIRMTSTGHVLTFNVFELVLVAVERGRR